MIQACFLAISKSLTIALLILASQSSAAIEHSISNSNQIQPVAHSTKPSIVIPLNNWSSQKVLSRAIGQYISTQGFPVSYQNISVADQWGALRQGLVHFQLEV